MKTLIIQLEPHDDLISIRDRMDWAKTPRVLLLWPKKGQVGIRPLDLALLRRHAASLGAELGLVTRNGEIRAAARELGISVFRTTTEAQKKTWVESGPVRPTRRFPRIDLRALRDRLRLPDPLDVENDPTSRVGVFSIGVVALLVVMLVFLPSARIRLRPPEQPQSVVISVSAEPDAEAVQLSGVIPMQKLLLTLEASDSLLVTGQVETPSGTAQGMGHFTNLTEDPVIIPAGTVLLAQTQPPVTFLTVEQAEIPAGKGEAVDILIRAANPGASGNVAAETITAFEGPLGLALQVTNPTATTGGSNETVFAPTDQDRETLRRRILADLDQQARERFALQVSTGDLLFPATLTMEKIVDETVTPPPGQPGEKLTMTFTAEYSMAYAAASDLEKLSALVLDASMPVGSMASPGTLVYKPVSPFFEGQDLVRWQMRAERQVRLRIDSEQVIALAQGKTARRAGSLLTETFRLVEPPQISIRPIWWPWLPLLPIQITVES